jgi:translocation and assembly module TamA
VTRAQSVCRRIVGPLLVVLTLCAWPLAAWSQPAEDPASNRPVPVVESGSPGPAPGDESDAPGPAPATTAKPRPDANYGFEVDAPEPLRGLIERQTLIGKWRTRKEYDPEQFEALFDRLHDEIEAILKGQGYFEGDIQVTGDSKKVHVKVTAGARTTVNRVELKLEGPVGNTPDVVQRARRSWSLPEGAFYTAAGWESSKRNLLDSLRQRGYLRARLASSKATVNVVNTTVALEVAIDSGPRIAFGELQVKGLGRYQRGIVDALLPFQPGQPYNFEDVQLFQTRLRNAGYFSGVYVVPDQAALDRDPDATTVPMLVELIERPVKRAIFGIGYSTDFGARGQVGFEHHNLFDRGLQLESGIITEQLRQRAFATVRTPTDADNHYYAVGSRYELQDIEGERISKTTFFVGKGRRIEKIESFTSLQYQIESQTVDATAGSELTARARALTLGYSWNYRDLDSRIDPRAGTTLSSQISGATQAIASDRTFLRLYTRAMHFFPLNRESPSKGGILIGLLEVGAVLSGGRDGIPSENLFRAGGAQSLRGYDYQSLGVVEANAIVGGRILAIASLEYQHPVYNDLWMAAFIDAGNAVDRIADYKAVKGYGLGLRWRTPIGPINLDLAYGEAVQRWRLQFSVGYTF